MPIPRAIAVLLAAAALAGPSAARTWTDRNGNQLSAELEDLRASTAALWANGESVTVRIDRLSESDQDWITRFRELTRTRDWPGGRRGRLDGADDATITIRRGSKVEKIPYGELSDQHRQIVAETFLHLRLPLPEALAQADWRTAPAGEETWTDLLGRRIHAELLGADSKYARFWMRGREYRVPLWRLSRQDRVRVAQRFKPRPDANPAAPVFDQTDPFAEDALDQVALGAPAPDARVPDVGPAPSDEPRSNQPEPIRPNPAEPTQSVAAAAHTADPPTRQAGDQPAATSPTEGSRSVAPRDDEVSAPPSDWRGYVRIAALVAIVAGGALFRAASGSEQ